jgi:hypothetical protein
MIDRIRSPRWAWLGVALMPLLLVALVVGGGIGTAGAQDATPADASPQDTPPALTEEEAGRPAHIHSGTCEGGGVGPVVQALNNILAPEGEAAGQDNAVTAESSFTTVPLTIDDILAVDHVVNVHLSFDEFETYIACGEIGGVTDEDGNLIIGLKEANESGFTGIAFLSPGADDASTDVSVFLAEGLTEGTETSPAASPLAVAADEAAEATAQAEGAEEEDEATPTS